MRKKLNILYLSECNDMGGAEHSLYRLMKGASDKGHQIYLASPEKGRLTELCKDIDVIHFDYDFKKIKDVNNLSLLKQIFRFVLKFKFFCIKNKIDIVHSNTVRTRFYLMFLTFFCWNIKTVAHVRDIQCNKYQKLLVKLIDNTIVISDAVYKSLEIFDNNKINRIYNGVEDLSTYKGNLNIKKDYSIHENTKIIGMVGRIEEWKRQDLFIDSALDILKKRNDCVFFIVGDCIKVEHKQYKDKIFNQVSQLESGSIYFTGHVENPFDYIKEFDLLVCPSNQEPFGRVVIEAMSLSKPVIGSNNGGLIEIITNFKEYQLFEYGDKASLVKNIEFMISDNNKKLVNEISNKNYLTYKEKFSIESNVNSIIEIYYQL
ncbi:hypothetical protein A6D98_01705 [Aliivibrio fischeri]|uniref:glycosyltransferase family 4 protein n=1 Tax=Aliivibrio fischeri TaxID=668 RepID=UPI00080DE9C1|nr:glycosyltransferase family 4 protein [Aliivibrio fischeri]OCH61299.1 hypothetical protein A6D98_01705 [Aliivibrio fischeri]